MISSEEKSLSIALADAVRRLIDYRESMSEANAAHLRSMPVSSDAKSGLFKASELFAFSETKPSAAGEQAIIEEIRTIGDKLFSVRGHEAMQDACDRLWDEFSLGGIGVDIVDKAWDGVRGWMA